MPSHRVISIGTLSRHPLWTTPAPPRTAHATTTLIVAGERRILVDPALPPQALAARLQERAGIGLESISDVFLTCFRPAHRGGIEALTHAAWWIDPTEREVVGHELIDHLGRDHDADVRALLERDVALLQRCQPAPDALAEHVDLFPLHGYTPGTCGLLLALPQATVVIAGDAVATVEHLESGRVLAGAYDLDEAQQSFRDVIEIADWIIPGHDNVTPNLVRRSM